VFFRTLLVEDHTFDLLDSAGGAVAKRLLPVAILAIVIVVVLMILR